MKIHFVPKKCQELCNCFVVEFFFNFKNQNLNLLTSFFFFSFQFFNVASLGASKEIFSISWLPWKLLTKNCAKTKRLGQNVTKFCPKTIFSQIHTPKKFPKKWKLWYKLLHITRMWKISTNKNTATNFPCSILWFRWFFRKLKFGILATRRGCGISQSSSYLIRLLPLVKDGTLVINTVGAMKLPKLPLKFDPKSPNGFSNE